jgi:hypothetical protein
MENSGRRDLFLGSSLATRPTRDVLPSAATTCNHNRPRPGRTKVNAAALRRIDPMWRRDHLPGASGHPLGGESLLQGPLHELLESGRQGRARHTRRTRRRLLPHPRLRLHGLLPRQRRERRASPATGRPLPGPGPCPALLPVSARRTQARQLLG